ncbi:hypothetical protein [Muriicola marianensis]|uniref:hypothetical protein n=1 Tax=Muriicola marianensis TaxID=1324801 RepID=UPI00166A90BE|nr:hypothetical protein [Muriicola marianensis]
MRIILGLFSAEQDRLVAYPARRDGRWFGPNYCIENNIGLVRCRAGQAGSVSRKAGWSLVRSELLK